MTNKLFENACNRISQPCPPIWMMRQAGRYQKGYMAMKEHYTFEQMCKCPELASEVAILPIKQFDFDIAILFSDILFPIEGLGVPLNFDPGPKFEWNINEENYQKHSDISKAIDHMQFQGTAIKLTREKLNQSKSLIGFVGGPWTLLNYATGKRPDIDLKWKKAYLEEVIVPVLIGNIKLQLESGAEKVMILDSGVVDMSESFFKDYYVKILKPLIFKDVGYYTQYLNGKCLETLYKMGWSGLGVDSGVDLLETFVNYTNGFIQGNFDQKKLLLPGEECKKEINLFCDKIESINHKGWICGLGHGIIKTTPENNVHLFIDIIRKRFK